MPYPNCPDGQFPNGDTGICETSPKNNGNSCDGGDIGNPVRAGTGNKWQREIDLPTVGALHFARTYNASPPFASIRMGTAWTHSFARSIESFGTWLYARRADGKAYIFNPSAGGAWATDVDIPDRLVELKDGSGVRTGWRYTVAADDSVETYDAAGKLQSIADHGGRIQTLAYDVAGRLDTVTDDTGRQLVFVYDTNNRIATVTDPAGGVITYGYDTQNNLVSVTYPDGRSKTYHYNEPEHTSGANLPHALTGITDENGDRFATYQYQADGKAISTGHAGGADLHTLTYNPDGSTTVTDPLGTQRTHNFTTILGVVKSTGQSQPGGSGCGPASSATTYDVNGNVASRADFNGNKTCYAYDLTRNLETARVEGLASGSACPSNLAGYAPAANTAERKILTQWDSRFRLPTKVTETGRETIFVYDSHGNVTSRSIKDTALNKTRTWTTSYTYHASVPGVLVQKVENGPRTDVADLTTTDYYAPDENCAGAPLGCRGQVRQVTNALGHVTTYDEYDSHGHVLRMTDPNGLVTIFSYTPRGWLETRDVGGEVTRFDYDGVGQIIKVTRPDGSHVGFEYDAAHRLTAIVDQDGSRLTYTLDNAGNRIREEITRPGDGYVYYSHSRTFDALGRLWQDIGAYNQTVTYEYDAKGNVKQIDGARSDVADVTRHDYDALDRLTQTLNADGGIEQFTPNALDQTTKVIDPANQATSHTVNALGDVIQTVSADTGTITRTYDEAGNLKTETDARGVTVTYTWDALNRLTGKSSSTGSPAYGYLYDSCRKGHLCNTLRAGSLNSYFYYDPLGRVRYQRNLGGVSVTTLYTYRPGGQIATITYPTGRSVSYSYDAHGRVSQIATAPASGTPATVLAGNFVYGYPFAGVQSFFYGNGLAFQQNRDQDYRPSNSIDGPRNKLLSHDPVGNVASLTDIDTTLLSYAYDPTDRLVSAIDTAAGSFGSLAWTYDKNGNRQSETRNAGTQSYVYSPANWLYQKGGETRTRTPNGNTALISGLATFTYDGFNRLISSQTAAETTTYRYNALGERYMKLNQHGLSTVFQYGRGGELLYERDTDGNIKEYVWLDGRPLARIDNGTAIYYYHVDHLGTPQAMSDSAGSLVWKASYEPFGKATVSAASTVENNLRFPGQYYDRETGLHYNYFRDYDPTTGRYNEFDLIGLRGGLNGYLYANANPLSYTDPLGLWSIGFELYGGIGGGINASYSNGTLELTGRVGVGLGGGFGYEPQGEPSPHSKKCGSGHIARTTVNLQAGVGAGPFGVGGSFTAASGNAVTTKVGGGYSSVSKTGLSVDNSKGFGARLGGSIGVDIGSYSNWGDQQCGCR